MRHTAPLLALALACGLSACVSDAIVFTTATHVGVEVNAMDNGKQTARIGYERAEFVSMPVRKADGTLRTEAYSVVSAFHLDTGSVLIGEEGLGPEPMKVVQIFATGAAAAVTTGSVPAIATAYRTLALGQGEEVQAALKTVPSKPFGELKSDVLDDWNRLRQVDAKRARALQHINDTLRPATPATADTATGVIDGVEEARAADLRALATKLRALLAE